MIPLLLIGARMAPHIVTATSAFVITTTSPVGVITHVAGGDVDWHFAIPLVLGGIVGRQHRPGNRKARLIATPHHPARHGAHPGSSRPRSPPLALNHKEKAASTAPCDAVLVRW